MTGYGVRNIFITDPDTGIQTKVEDNGSLPVTLQDQTTPPVLVYANKVVATTTLAADIAIDDYSVTVASATGIVAGQYFGIFNVAASRYYAGTVLGVAGVVITLDTPIDFAYLTGDTVGSGLKDMAVDGSVTPQIFTLRGADPGIDLTIDITRFMFQITTSTAANFSDFGDIAGGITKGVVIRRVDGSYQNYLNIKKNSELANFTFDYNTISAFNPSGDYGVTARLTTAGQSKMGVVSRVGPNENIEIIIQDDLSSLLSFTIIFEGSVAIV